MGHYVIRRLLLMVPTFIGITAVAFYVMQMAGEHSFQDELRKLTGAGAGGEKGAGSSRGRSDGSLALSLEQWDRMLSRYELDIPRMLNFSAKDRSDRVAHAIRALGAPMPQVDLSPLRAVLAGQDEILGVMGDYETRSQDPASHWNLEESFKNSMGGRLASLEITLARSAEMAWNNLMPSIGVRKAWREERERARVTLGHMGDRLIPALAECGSELDAASWAKALTSLEPVLPGVRTREDFEAWWRQNSLDFDDARQLEMLEEWLDRREGSPKGLELEERLFKYPQCLAETVYDLLDSELDEERIPRLLKAFERSTRCDTIPFIEHPEEEGYAAAVDEARKWWRRHSLEFVEMTPLHRSYAVVRETRYGRWLNDIAHLDFRESKMESRPVMDAIGARLPVSLTFGAVSFLLAYFVCIPLGVIKAVRHGSPFDLASSVMVFIGYSIPGWAFGFILLVVFGGGTFPELAWFPLQGFQGDNYDTLDFWGKVGDRIHHAFLPILAYSIGSFATLTVLMKNSLLENLGADYVRTAFAKGLSERRVIFVHTLRNSLIPLCTMMGHLLSFALAGSYLIESVFNINGFGLLGFKALQAYDINLMMGSLVIGAVLQLTGNLFSDLLYSAVDPRIRFS